MKLGETIETLGTVEAATTKGELKPGWHVVRFDEVAQLVNDRIDNPAASVERYVGLEHLDLNR